MAATKPTTNKDEIVSEIRIAAPPQRVFEALVDPAQVVKWWGQTGIYRCTQFESDVRVGGKWRSLGIDGNGSKFEVAGEYLQVDPPRLARSLICSHSGGMGKYHLNQLRLSWHIRRRFSQREITTIYANRAYFGVGIVGIEKASQGFFQKEPGALSTEEAALIAGLLHAPDYFSPRRHPELALQRRNKVLEEMVAQGKLGAEEAGRLKAAPIITQ